METTTKHTKGEWILNESRYEILSENDCRKNGGIDLIAQCFTGFNVEETVKEAQANAKLIAAAPELLEALMTAKSILDKFLFPSERESDPTYQKVIKAITKATKYL